MRSGWRSSGSGPARTRGAARSACLAKVCAAAWLLLAGAAPAGAFSWFDGKVELHGYFAEQIRALANDFDPDEEYDLAQWYNVLAIELEVMPFPNGIGPLEIVEFYVRGEARYDCIWTRGCGMFPSVNTYGNRAEHLPPRLIDGRNAGFVGSLRSGDRRYYANVKRETVTLENPRDGDGDFPQRPLRFHELPNFVSLFAAGKGPNFEFEPVGPDFGDDPPPFVFDAILSRCKFGVRNAPGGENGTVSEIIGPWNPGCPIREIGALRFKPNPFHQGDVNPILLGVDRRPGTGTCVLPTSMPLGCEPLDRYTNGPIIPTGVRELPYRVAPFHRADERGLDPEDAQGLYLPSAGLVRELKSGKLDSIDQNFGQQELAWNHGASQQDERELKEAYVDIEAAEGRLWMRLGKQTIVWGKTELFRNTDQFNPQDFALASLPGLEESRIALWSARGTWSFYNVGKLEDVRLELAMNFDDFEPADLGRCGEPFSLELVCGITLGYFAHGIAGVGLAGHDKPPAPWNDVEGIEAGARVEWRYKRFSFQVSDFYGYDDFPYPRRISTYERNVDETSGRPRRSGARGACRDGSERACLGRRNGVRMGPDAQPLRVADLSGPDGVPDGFPETVIERGTTDPILAAAYKTGELIIEPEHKSDVLRNHPANQTTWTLANTLCGVSGPFVDPRLCAFATPNGLHGPGGNLSSVANGASALLAGSPAAIGSATSSFARFVCWTTDDSHDARPCRNAMRASLIRLNLDPGDGVGAFSDGGGSFAVPGTGNPWADQRPTGQALGQALSPAQEALWGCGPYYQIDCDLDGIDILNSEASAILQSWPGFDGTQGYAATWDVRASGQPGTLHFRGGPVATRWSDGRQVMLPGSRGPLDPGYDATVDGCVDATSSGCRAGDNGRTAAAITLFHPYAGSLDGGPREQFRSEMAATSWNFLVTVLFGGRELDEENPKIDQFDPRDPYGDGYVRLADGTRTDQLRRGADPQRAAQGLPTACGIYLPLLCSSVRGILSAAGARRNSVRAGGDNGYGRRDWAWHSGGELVLDYQKRNVLGFAFDFDENRTKSNWGFEMTWVNRQPFVSNDEWDGIAKVNTLNLTISADRPAFIDFLNPGRTFFFNSQWFFQYIDDYDDNFYANGPINVLATFTAFTGYHQDRLMFFNTLVYDFLSRSGALLPSVIYRFTESFSVTVGANVFWGRTEWRDAPINEIRPALNRTGKHAYEDAVANGLSALRERDELYLNIRYTF
ncbi:MAG: hypothetical protein DCC71_02840 [Proteobacteria bacterium]|nr:MAG: hypothetical protein DCC71_02840 [Pseudomonadota bacterium]